MSTTLIFKDNTVAENAIQDANQSEALEINGTNNLFSIHGHPDSEDSRVAVYVPKVFTNRSWYPEFESKADEVVEELGEDWFDEEKQ
jgi:hypothetical protein